MAKTFLYDPASVTSATLAIMRRKGYDCVELTNNAQDFWHIVQNLQNNDIFVLLSHGDANGPLAVKGTLGDDINLVTFAQLIVPKNITLYLLSCHTGNNPCAQTLLNNHVQFVAPMGNASFVTVGTEAINVNSVEGTNFPGWTGVNNLIPGRANRALPLP